MIQPVRLLFGRKEQVRILCTICHVHPRPGEKIFRVESVSEREIAADIYLPLPRHATPERRGPDRAATINLDVQSRGQRVHHQIGRASCRERV